MSPHSLSLLLRISLAARATTYFAFANGATLSGTADGLGGNDTLTFVGNTTSRAIVLTSIGSVDGFNGTAAGGNFANINALVGGNGVDTLTG